MPRQHHTQYGYQANPRNQASISSEVSSVKCMISGLHHACLPHKNATIAMFLCDLGATILIKRYGHVTLSLRVQLGAVYNAWACRLVMPSIDWPFVQWRWLLGGHWAMAARAKHNSLITPTNPTYPQISQLSRATSDSRICVYNISQYPTSDSSICVYNISQYHPSCRLLLQRTPTMQHKWL